jgi:uncharacterized delta-60 repeat protein
MQIKLLVKTLLAASCLLLSINNLKAQSGTLDPTFGTAGLVTTNFPNTQDGSTIRGLAVNPYDPTQKIVAAGYALSEAGYYQFALARYDSSGVLDPTFGNAGTVVNAIGSTGAQATCIVLQPDGKIVVAGVLGVNGTSGNTQMAVARYLANGNFDSTFGTNGITITSIDVSSTAAAIDIQTDGKIVVAGTATDNTTSYMALVRYNTDGSIDNTFGTNGIVAVLIGSSSAAYAVKVQGDGNILVGGTGLFTLNIFALARFTTSGGTDFSFGDDGIDTTTIGLTCYLKSIALQNNGQIVAAGYYTSGPGYSFALARYNTDGSLDDNFGNNGLVTTTVSSGAQANAVTLQSDSKIVAAGYVLSTGSFAMVRYNTDGSIDNTFGASQNGIVITKFPGNFGDQAYSIALGTFRIYLGGEGGGSFGIAAYGNDAGALPVSFLSFNGVINNGVSVLNWSTTNEVNNKGFEVERSYDGVNFSDIGFVTGKGNTASVNNYTYTDTKVLSGSNYYRLKQIDLDGTFMYSSVILLDYSKFGWSILGNPVTNNSWIQLQLDKPSTVSIQIISLNGTVIQTINPGNIAAGTYSFPLNLNSTAAGMYVVKLMVNNTIYTKNIVK